MGDQIWPKMKMKLNKAERICFRTDFGNEKKIQKINAFVMLGVVEGRGQSCSSLGGKPMVWGFF